MLPCKNKVKMCVCVDRFLFLPEIKRENKNETK